MSASENVLVFKYICDISSAITKITVIIVPIPKCLKLNILSNESVIKP